MKIKTYHIRFVLMLGAFILAWVEPSWATGRTEEMPWEEPIEKAVNSLSGNTAKFLAIAAIVMTGLALAFSEGGGGMRR
ncbi:MAG: TrbC/VirB2 family protein, partial [Gemmatimonadetes bacterium]|nr:TrbC/VirB2 family protein [Gemmatimonadota bacterium]